MSGRRFIGLLIAALVVIALALILNDRRRPGADRNSMELLPTLAARTGSLTSVSMRKGGATPQTTLHLQGREWTVAERGDYPADVAKLRRLLSSLRDARIVEEKTSDTRRYAQIGVDDPGQPGATGTEIILKDPAGALGLIVGKSLGRSNFVRLAGENASYSVEPAISLESEPRFWIDARLVDVPTAEVQAIEVKPAGAAGYALRRPKAADAAFTLEGVPPGRKALEAGVLAPSPSLLTGLEAEDVMAAKDIDFGQSWRMFVTTADGGVLTLTGAVAGTHHWIQISSTKDAALNAKMQGRAFEIASYRYDALFKPLEQLLQPKETGAAKPLPGRPTKNIGVAPAP